MNFGKHYTNKYTDRIVKIKPSVKI